MSLSEKRIEECQALMRKGGFDLLILSPSFDMYYFSGFRDEAGERMLLLLIPADGSPIFIAPQLYEEHIKRDSFVQNVRIWKDSADPTELLSNTLRQLRLRNLRILVDDDMRAVFLLSLKSILPHCEFTPASTVISCLRIRKSMEEIERLERASSIADKVFDAVSKLDITGMTEVELAAQLEYEMKRWDARKVAFETLVAAGLNGALPHHRAGTRIIEEGDVVVIDYGCRWQGYCSDITRTIVCKAPTNKVREVYDIVKLSQEAAFQSVKPGIAAEEIDRVARAIITEKGYGEYFIHRTGHGIGLAVHEPPYIVEGNNTTLEEGMTFTVEPGIYLPGQFGVRIEDIILVTSEGGRRLNNCSRELQVVN